MIDKEYQHCPRCGGTGRVEKPMWLYPEERGGVGGVEALAKRLGVDLPSERRDYFVGGAASIFEACREGLQRAKATKLPSVFEFDERVVIVRPTDDAEAVARAWWVSVYKQTPEESWASR